jgi:hypothetical protein
MTFDHGRNKDFWAGGMFLTTGALAVGIARTYPFGTTLRMGPGYFPVVLGGILICFGLVIMARGLRRPERISAPCSLRALIVLPVTVILFGVLIDRAGFVPAMAVLVFGSTLAGRDFRWKQVMLLTVSLTVLSVILFIWGLRLAYPLFTLF